VETRFESLNERALPTDSLKEEQRLVEKADEIKQNKEGL